ncbi:MAG: 5-methylaminomethyl-2-thiouridine methyltransferase, partial [Pseudomonadota bacterium]|nr:5-methylaminomethyl-2-thiouridine methyltransferase [Pseudomonadota bacterium]
MTHSNSTPDNPDTAPLTWHDGDMPFSTAFGDHFYCQTDGRL